MDGWMDGWMDVYLILSQTITNKLENTPTLLFLQDGFKGTICKNVAKNGYYTQIQNTAASLIHFPLHLHSKDLKRTRIWLSIKSKFSYCPAAAGKCASSWTVALLLLVSSVCYMNIIPESL